MGDSIMLSAAAKLFERTILVYTGDGAKPITIGTDKTKDESHETILLGYISNNHNVSIEKPGIVLYGVMTSCYLRQLNCLKGQF